MERRCPQCWMPKPWPAAWSGRARGWCDACKNKYRGWARKTDEEKDALRSSRRGLQGGGETCYFACRASGNRKLGGIPSVISGAQTCPTTCPFRGSGCFAEFHPMKNWWRRANVGHMSSVTLGQLERWLRRLPGGQLWRYGTAGDLPGSGDEIDGAALETITLAARHTRGFTYTHKPVLSGDVAVCLRNRQKIALANANGFTVSLSADGVHQVDLLAELGIAPVVVVVPSDHPADTHSIGGRKIIVCPAELDSGMTCAHCRICQLPGRETVVAFRAHGQMKAAVSRKVTR